MVKILKSRVTKFVEARFQGRHTGKTGYISTQPRGSPKPFPFGIAEEFGANFYPQYRPLIPKNLRKYTDSYIDLRNKPYKVWYDKWGKPHINKWWQEQLDATLRFQKAYKDAQTERKRGYTRAKFNGWYNSGQYSRTFRYRKPINLRCRKCFEQYRSSGQRPYCKCRSSHGTNKYRFQSKKSR